jgi:hypothetical protein
MWRMVRFVYVLSKKQEKFFCKVSKLDMYNNRVSAVIKRERLPEAISLSLYNYNPIIVI